MATRLDRRAFHKLSLASAGGTLALSSMLRADEPRSATSGAAKPLNDADPEPLPFVDGSFTIVALPDTQKYCQKYPKHYFEQTKWIAENRDKHNILFVTHLGDITNNNVKPQWEVARKAMKTLDGVVPYSVLAGNHDFGKGGSAADRSTLMGDYFTLDDVSRQPTFGGFFHPERPETSYHTFQAGDRKFLVLALEFGPSDEIVAWADDIVARHSDHQAILTTHAYLFHDNRRYDWAKYGDKQRWNPHAYRVAKLPGATVNDGQELWDKLVSKHDNFILTLNGHVLLDGQGQLSSDGAAGNVVHQVLTNYQNRPEGGQGWMRLIEFLPDGETIQMRTYSPSLDRYRTDEQGQHQFVLKLASAVTS